MSGFAGGGGAGGPPGPGGCAGYGVFGYVEMATLGQVDARTALGVACPLVIGPPNLRLHIGVGNCVFLDPPAGGLNMPGAVAMDWQSTHAAPTQVAYGALSSAFGASNTVSALSPQATAIGYNNTVGYGGVASPYSAALGRQCLVSGPSSVAIGAGSSALAANVVSIGSPAYAAAADGIAIGHTAVIGPLATRSIVIGLGSGATTPSSLAIGPGAQATGAYSNAFGTAAIVRQPRTTVITSPIVTRRDNGELLADADLYFSGANVLIMFPEIALDPGAPPVNYTLTLFGGLNLAHMWVEEVGLILTTVPVPPPPPPAFTQPTVQFGTIALPAKFLAPTLCTLLTALRMRERFNLLLTDDPEVNLSFGITVAGTASLRGRPYFRGHIVEDE